MARRGDGLTLILSVLVLMTGGCISISLQTQPEDISVQALLKGRDCVEIFLAFGFGTATIERAKANGEPFEKAGQYSTRDNPKIPIVKVRRVETTEFMSPIFGERCVVVTGEGEAKKES